MSDEKQLQPRQPEDETYKFNPDENPEQCLACNSHPHWDMITDGEVKEWECINCGAVINSKGEMVKEPIDQEDEEEDLWDDDEEEEKDHHNSMYPDDKI
jgi:Zn ribbon nucleic-acid-binding protein